MKTNWFTKVGVLCKKSGSTPTADQLPYPPRERGEYNESKNPLYRVIERVLLRGKDKGLLLGEVLLEVISDAEFQSKLALRREVSETHVVIHGRLERNIVVEIEAVAKLRSKL